MYDLVFWISGDGRLYELTLKIESYIFHCLIYLFSESWECVSISYIFEQRKNTVFCSDNKTSAGVMLKKLILKSECNLFGVSWTKKVKSVSLSDCRLGECINCRTNFVQIHTKLLFEEWTNAQGVWNNSENYHKTQSHMP